MTRGRMSTMPTSVGVGPRSANTAEIERGAPEAGTSYINCPVSIVPRQNVTMRLPGYW